MKKELLAKGLSKVLLGLALLAALLFLPAGTWRYPGAWLFLCLLFVPVLLLGAALLWKAPQLLRKRLNAKEKEGEQKTVLAVSALMFVGGFVLAGLDHRFGFTSVPRWLQIAASAVFLLSYGLYAEVMRENVWLSRTVEVQQGQQVVSTGLYGVVRHPMYAVTVLMFLSIPLILGSLAAFCVFLIYPVLMVLRIRNEEKVLEEGLAGYREYQRKVKYRLCPLIW